MVAKRTTRNGCCAKPSVVNNDRKYGRKKGELNGKKKLSWIEQRSHRVNVGFRHSKVGVNVERVKDGGVIVDKNGACRVFEGTGDIVWI